MLLEKPGPKAALTEFGDKGFVFTLSYWLDLSKADGYSVASDLRQMIVNRLAESGIALANAPQPVQVQAPDTPKDASKVSN
jgi:small-conductance mechanosensitive channel